MLLVLFVIFCRVERYRNLVTFRRIIANICSLSGIHWEAPLFITPPICPSSLGLSCVPVCPCCSALMYLHGSPGSYSIALMILPSIQSDSLERSISMSWLVVLCFTSFSICDSMLSVERFGL